MPTKTYHLLNDFGVYKSTLKRNYYDNDRDETVADVEALLKERRQRYTLAECKRLFLFLWTAHHDCVVANQEDFNRLQVCSAKAIIRHAEYVLARVKELEQEAKTNETQTG